ncbi:DNA-3-methyladenine glycosylase [Paenarthrobacter sp. Z7-10]|uniref:DNA-3-methyladenine glycosylase n=1 Tax=Paenarthrobacter sp. Z7-10 TaxID=2787635 RepID=UPI0022A964D1|nr:DNA-3-methyladenine glycosylase [Paenarthrobacter sp. Z7-10]MCZ2404315.1 DNA-3-methyladenine glycosylase [Paenarthrobacter sp. Z7-10]
MGSNSADSELLELLRQPSTAAAPRLLGAVVRHSTPAGTVAVRLTEVEAYLGPEDSAAPDPGSHSFRGQTARNAVMFGPPGHLYVYFTYGMHYCANLVCSDAGTASGVLMRAGEVVEGLELARERRTASRLDSDLAQGPARLAVALGIGREDNGSSILGAAFHVGLGEPVPGSAVSSGPRVGVSGAGGDEGYPWRFWITGDRTVSRYKPAAVRKRLAVKPEAR